MLSCKLCDGYFRFAHTLIACGHTFCQVCLFFYIKSHRGSRPQVKCPTCKKLIEDNYRKSVSRDVFKQALVDSISEDSVKRQTKIITRVGQLFSSQPIRSMRQEYFNEQLNSGMNFKNTEESSLALRVAKKFNLDLQDFKNKILKDQSFQLLKKQKFDIQSQQYIIINIEPKSDYDMKYIALKGLLRLKKSLPAFKIVHFIEKQLLKYINRTGRIPLKVLNFQTNQIISNVKLFCQGQLIDQNLTFLELNLPVNHLVYCLKG